MTSSDQAEERRQYFSIIFFVYREMRVPNHQQQISPVSVWPLALIICCEVLLNVASTNFTSGNSFPAYFDLKCEPGTAWTFVMSWSVGYRWPPPFTKFPFKYNSPVNENAQNWNPYRLSLVRMRSLQGHSTHWRATCSYPTYGIDFRDYLRRNFKDFNIVDFLGDRQCKKVEYINTRGHVGTHLKVPFWQRLNSYTLHTDSTNTHRQFKTMKTEAVSGEDNFGHYGSIKTINSKFRCTHSHQSTTQWWFGAHM